MDYFRNKKILFICSYSSIYGGNFIPSLVELENTLNSKGGYAIISFLKKPRRGTGLVTCKG